MEHHEYNLQRYAGISSRHTCPSCGRKRCFTLYVDESGDALHETVGRCDHESSCGYHYTPKQYFHDHPDRVILSASEESPRHPRGGMQGRRSNLSTNHQTPKQPCTIPTQYLTRSVRTDLHSNFTTFLLSIMPQETVASLIERYRIGVTRASDVIFFQIDAKGRLRTGKVMKYDPNTGHRIKEESTPGRITWIHSIMKQQGLLPRDWQLTQCLFGEHLLPQYPGAEVALVESEKTAIICAAYMPQYLWLATGGKSQLSEDRLHALQGRKVTAFPDIDAFQEWTDKFARMPHLGVKVSDWLQTHATPNELSTNMDLADWLLIHQPLVQTIGKRSSPVILSEREESPHSRPALEYVFDCISPQYHAELQALIDDLDLVPIAIHKK